MIDQYHSETDIVNYMYILPYIIVINFKILYNWEIVLGDIRDPLGTCSSFSKQINFEILCKLSLGNNLH